MILINGHDFRIADGESRIFWTLPENLSKKKRSNMQKQVEPKETKRLEPAGWGQNRDPSAQNNGETPGGREEPRGEP